ncbi:hypothetical protein BDP27DRAFT_500221 [Rhodocollybia butyracea]|uniref:Uncharacterized protein n=1 Tax=Rhodocollybia butyracea TaxID=206335 RepID=A0A9P5PSY0_9AGAR|nr:hypothetical protein BDP27DRAFT_500221 [Rhodocollybia butyracea]
MASSIPTNSNGFVEIVGCVVDKYRSPRIYPPLNFAPFPRRAGSGPGPGSTPNPPPPPPPSSVPVSPPASPPPSPVRYRAAPLPSSALPSINTPAVRSDDVPKYYSAVTLRSPKREREEGHSRRGAHPTPTASPRKAKDSPSRSPQIKREPVSLPQIPASPHHRRTVHSAQSTPKRSSSALLHFPSTPATQFSSPMRQSPTRSAVVIDSSDGESYPPGSDFDSETESSEPEDVTPMRTELLMSCFQSRKGPQLS